MSGAKPLTLPASALAGTEPAGGSPARSEDAARPYAAEWHPYSERRPTALERAAERYRIACVAERAAGVAFRAEDAGEQVRYPARPEWVAAYDARIVAAREHNDALLALLAVARGDL